ncbi:MAG: hypothetical protein QXW62_06895 [Candidatus Methanomethylicaceae archaeon]|nr:hypothetical protein [Candidatus Verstraetearchaeota archaeon]
MISKIRIIGGFFVFIIMFLLFSYIPLNLQDILKKFLPIQIVNEIVPIINQILHPFLPIIGALLAIFVALGIILKKTKLYGLIIIISSILWLCYIYFALNGGYIKIIHSMLSINIDLKFFMLIIFIPIILDLIKGVLIIIKSSELKI